MSATLPLQKIVGFESTHYAMLRGQVVWAGLDARTDHPRNAHRPWRAEPLLCDAASLRAGAARCLAMLGGQPDGPLSTLPHKLPAKGLLLWLTNRPLAFPLERATPRFDAIRDALQRNALPDFEAAAVRVIGLGEGLTPSGDDFLGGICFALQHAPREAWRHQLARVLAHIRAVAATGTNPISAALLDDLIAGSSYRAAHEMMAALQRNAAPEIASAARSLLSVGASSGADILAGVLLALLTTPDSDAPASS